MRNKETVGSKIFNMCNALFMIIMMVITFYPMLYVVFASFSVPSKFTSHAGILLRPAGFSVSSYQAVLKNPMIRVGYVNTIIIVVVGVVLGVLLTSMGAYFLSRKKIMLKNAFMMFIVFTMFFNGGLIPFYLTVTKMHLDRSLLALILPVAINTFNLIIMRTAFMAIPDSMEESAKLDGAGHFTILFRIIIPLALPTVAVMLLFYGVGYWNAWFNAMIFLRDRELYPLQLVLREILIQNDTSSMNMSYSGDSGDEQMITETIKYAVIVIATVPILSLYPFLQRYFIKGIMIGAIKE